MTDERKVLDIESATRRSLFALVAIMDEVGKRRGVSGVIDCPNDCGGKLAYSVAASNGHIMARCSTPNCCAFMQ